MTTQTASPSTSQAVRQPCSPMTPSISRGVDEIPTAPTADTMPVARPRRRSNHSATAVVAVSPSAPWPAMRIPTNPAVSPTTEVTKDSPIRSAPNASPMTAIVRRTPYRSSARPIHGSAIAPARVPTR
jgi:hypothetical protein